MNFTQSELDGWMKIAEDAAVSAGDLLLKSSDSDSGRVVKDSSGHDIKISADRLSEDIIIGKLKICDFPILTEESGLIPAGKENVSDTIKWIVDPLDGSMNYFRRIPSCCVSIALYESHNPILGVVYDFNRQELFSGITGAGAWLNRKKIMPSQVSNTNQAILCTGFPVGMNLSPSTLEHFIHQVRSYKKIRMIGSAALSLAYVASGRADAYMEKEIKFWDVAGGLAVLHGAGGRFTLAETEQKYSFNVTASSTHL